jgi:hypothetical protein
MDTNRYRMPQTRRFRTVRCLELMRQRKQIFFGIAYYLIGVATSTLLIVREQYLWATSVLLFYLAARFVGKLAASRHLDGIVLGLLHLGSGQVPKSFLVQHFVNSAPKTDLGNLEYLVQSTIERLEKKGRIEVKGDVISRII